MTPPHQTPDAPVPGGTPRLQWPWHAGYLLFTVLLFAEVFFAGKIDFNHLSVFERMLCKLIKSPAGDLRDWPAIRSWSQTIFA